VANHAAKLKIGDTLDPQTEIGPIASRRQLDKVLGYLDIGKAEGARVATGGSRLQIPNLEEGYYVAPTVFADATPDMRVVREEIFGPVVSALPFDDMEHAVRLANDTTFGLGAGMFTRNVNLVHRAASRLQSGTVWVNCYQEMDPALPFGGYKMSGNGRESGIDHINDFMSVKSLMIKLT